MMKAKNRAKTAVEVTGFSWSLGIVVSVLVRAVCISISASVKHHRASLNDDNKESCGDNHLSKLFVMVLRGQLIL